MPRNKKLFCSKKGDYGKNKMAKSEQLSVIIHVRHVFYFSGMFENAKDAFRLLHPLPRSSSSTLHIITDDNKKRKKEVKELNTFSSANLWEDKHIYITADITFINSPKS